MLMQMASIIFLYKNPTGKTRFTAQVSAMVSIVVDRWKHWCHQHRLISPAKDLRNFYSGNRIIRSRCIKLIK